MNKTILIVEDNPDLQKYLKEFLLDNDFLVLTASEGVKALKLIEKSNPDLIILDLGLPDMSGESVCAEIRKNYPSLKIIILSARNDTQDIIKGLGLGADDYITKPFQLDELLARIQVRFRQNAESNSIKKVNDLFLNTQTHEVKRKNKEIILSPTEFKLLDYLMENKGKVMSREMILTKIWLTSPDIETRAVDVYIGYLRKKVDTGSSKPLIHSVRGFGYILKE